MGAHRRVLHGTRAGYDKHRRVRKGNWGWPTRENTCGCKEAYRVYQTDYTNRAQTQAGNRERSTARQRAFRRLQQLHAADYAKLYAEELSIIRDGGKSALAGMQQQLDAVLAGVDMITLERLMRHGMASLPEREKYFRVLQLRQRVAEIERRAAEESHGTTEEGEPVSDS